MSAHSSSNIFGCLSKVFRSLSKVCWCLSKVYGFVSKAYGACLRFMVRFTSDNPWFIGACLRFMADMSMFSMVVQDDINANPSGQW